MMDALKEYFDKQAVHAEVEETSDFPVFSSDFISVLKNWLEQDNIELISSTKVGMQKNFKAVYPLYNVELVVNSDYLIVCTDYDPARSAQKSERKNKWWRGNLDAKSSHEKLALLRLQSCISGFPPPRK